MKAVQREPAPAVDLAPMAAVLQKFAHKKGAIIPLLQETQELFGYLPQQALVRIAEATNTDISKIYGVATFYSQFRLKPVGKHIIRVCHGTACHVSGAERVTEVCEEFLGVKDGDTTPDGLFTLESVACLGCCSLAPVMMIDSTVYGRLDDRQTRRVLKQYQE